MIKVKFFFQDNGLETNFYLIQFNNINAFPEYGVIEDEFFQGNEMFGLIRSADIKADDELYMSVQGIDQRYFNYMNKLITIAGSSGGSPFATPPASQTARATAPGGGKSRGSARRGNAAARGRP